MLISGSESSKGSIPESKEEEGDREKIIQAAKLLSIQREVGFNFQQPEGDTLKQLVQEENVDRAKKTAWENKEGDQ
jgi:hypothetical protein